LRANSADNAATIADADNMNRKEKRVKLLASQYS
jgi:hypothetical protein